jgi:hypothetical protein
VFADNYQVRFMLFGFIGQGQIENFTHRLKKNQLVKAFDA